MDRLEAKKIKGHTYYYYSVWGWVDGKCRRIRQKYLGKLEDIAQAMEGGGPAPLYAEVFQWGLPTALWRECRASKLIEEIDARCPKRKQGLSIGEYLAVAAINRAICPRSKRSMWDWFSQTALLGRLPRASKATLASQRFWDQMDRIDGERALRSWTSILADVVKREAIDLSSVSYDGTNFYTFIDTFNMRCQLARRGKNKQGRGNLRQVSYALFCAADGHLPLYYDVYEGNRHDAKQFPLMLQRFHDFLKELATNEAPPPDTTIIFDKGNNSRDNFVLLDSLTAKDGGPLGFVGSVKLGEHQELARRSNHDASFEPLATEGLEGTKAFRVKKKIAGLERVLVVTYNQNLFNAQWLTVQNDITQAVEQLSRLRQKLEDRANGVLRRGKAPTEHSVKTQCKKFLSRQHLKRVIHYEVTLGAKQIPRLQYTVDTEALHQVSDTLLGKNIIITNREGWDNGRIIQAYRSQFIIEDVFKEMKDRTTGSWWPLNHWTDAKIRVHALYCTLALMLRALMLRRVRQAGIDLSMARLLSELGGIRQVVNIYPKKRGQKKQRTQMALSKTNELQQQLISALALAKEKRPN